jgi:hypothetical protein
LVVSSPITNHDKWYTVEGVDKFGHGFEDKLRLVQG